MDKFLPPQEEPQAGPFGHIPEERIVIIGDDSSMQVIVPEDSPAVKVVDSDIDNLDPV
jgi:hypothetical protein